MIERKAKTREFLSRFFRNHALREDEDIFALGFVNSLLAMQLLDFENFKSINAIDNLIGRKGALASAV